VDGVEFKARKAEQAIEAGLKELGLTAEEADIEIISQGGLLSKAVVRITPKVKPEQAAADFINNLFTHMHFDAYASLVKTEEETHINISGADSALLIGYRGDMLDSIQYLALLIANKGAEEFVRISVDAENYREKRKEILTQLAERLALKADRTGRKVELEPMNPYERRIIHAALQNSEIVTTESVGEEPNRYLVILPKNPKPYSSDRPYRNDRPYNRDRGDRPFNRERSGSYNNSGERSGYGGERRTYNNGERSGYNNGERSGGYNNSGSGGYNSERRTYNNGERSGYNGGERSGGYNSERRTYNNGERSDGYNRPREERPDYSESVKSDNVSRETTAAEAVVETPVTVETTVEKVVEKAVEKDFSEVNNNFTNNFKKTGTTKIKSFGYKKR
jgi:spoIIIJ-associated protein